MGTPDSCRRFGVGEKFDHGGVGKTKADKYVPKGALHAMDCTDIVIGYARGDLSRVVDSYTRDRSTPQNDEFWGGESDIVDSLGYEDGEGTTIVFRKPVEANHPSDHNIVDNDMHVIWARGQEEGMLSCWLTAPKSITDGGHSVQQRRKQE